MMICIFLILFELLSDSVNNGNAESMQRKKNDGIDAWPKLKGTKQDIEYTFEKVRM